MTRQLLSVIACAAGLAACATQNAGRAGGDSAVPADAASTTGETMLPELSAAEREAGWRLLFDGRTLDGWRGYGRPDMPAGWVARDGLLIRESQAADIITRETFRDFELALDWMVRAGGNSGVFYRAAEGQDAIYFSAPELQVLDDAAHPDGASPLTSAGAAYGLYPAPRGVVKPAGEWNAVRVLVRGDHVEHWLNGQRIVAYELHSEDWKARVAASKFRDWAAYGQARQGHIGLQDHGDWVAYRNIRIRALP